MKQTNWLDLDGKLVDRFDMADLAGFCQVALGHLALSFSGEGVQITPDFLTPFILALSGAGLSGTAGQGIAYDPNGFGIYVPANGNVFNIATASAVNPRKDLLVIYYNQVGGTPIPKPGAPLTTVYQYLLDSFTITTRTGTPGASPAYPTKQPGDVILGGILVPANATLGTSCTIDLTVREQGYIPADRMGIMPTTNFFLERSSSFQQFCAFLDNLLAVGSMNIADDGNVHDSAIIAALSVGTPGDTITIAGTVFTVGSGAGQIPVQATPTAMAYALARAIRDSVALNATYTAAAGQGFFVGLMALASGAVGGAISTTGTTFSLGSAALSGNRARWVATAPTVKQQLDQLDFGLGNNTLVTAANITAAVAQKGGVFIMTASNVLNLPLAFSYPNIKIYVKNYGAGAPTIVTQGPDTIQEAAAPGSDTVLNLVPGRSVILIPDGVNNAWHVFG